MTLMNLTILAEKREQLGKVNFLAWLPTCAKYKPFPKPEFGKIFAILAPIVILNTTDRVHRLSGSCVMMQVTKRNKGPAQ